MSSQPLPKPSAELAKNLGVRFRGGRDDERRARGALLAEEIELRRHIEREALQRRALPQGGVVQEPNYARLQGRL